MEHAAFDGRDHRSRSDERAIVMPQTIVQIGTYGCPAPNQPRALLVRQQPSIRESITGGTAEPIFSPLR